MVSDDACHCSCNHHALCTFEASRTFTQGSLDVDDWLDHLQRLHSWLRHLKSSGSFWPESTPWYGPIFPAVAIIAFIPVVIRKIKRAQSPAIAAEKVARYGALWQSIFAASWLFSWGEFLWGLVALALAGIGFGAMTLLKELGGSTDQPIAYRG